MEDRSSSREVGAWRRLGLILSVHTHPDRVHVPPERPTYLFRECADIPTAFPQRTHDPAVSMKPLTPRLPLRWPVCGEPTRTPTWRIPTGSTPRLVRVPIQPCDLHATSNRPLRRELSNISQLLITAGPNRQ